jgi:PadR family transcriptional regulator, regulatory protein PadR
MTTGQPMREPTFHVLAAMLDGPLHGYGIIRRAHELTDGRVRLAAGTLYAALDRLRDTGLVDIDHEEIVDGRARRYYRLTGAGREALRTEARRMARAAKLVLRHARAEQ